MPRVLNQQNCGQFTAVRPFAIRCAPPFTRRRGFTLAECLVCTMITGLMIVAAQEAMRSTTAIKEEVSMQARALPLCQELLSEITCKSYQDPKGFTVFGRDADDVGLGRLGFDDVDDYVGYSENPPADRAGIAYSGVDNWIRNVKVYWVNAANPNTAESVETGYKRIDVTASFRGRDILQLSAVRTREVP